MSFMGKFLHTEYWLNSFHKVSGLTSKMMSFYKQYGAKATLKRILHHKQIEAKKAERNRIIEEKVRQEEIWKQISDWIDKTPHSFIDIFPFPMGWNTPLFQRFQHMSLQAGNVGGISFYGAHPQVDIGVDTYQFITPTLCIVNLLDRAVVDAFWKILDQKEGIKVVRIQSIDLVTKIEEIQRFIDKGYRIVYEYIDELSPQIMGNVPDYVIKRHEYLLKNEKVTVVATSDKLYAQCTPLRSKNMAMLNNGVDYDHWNVKYCSVCPKEIEDIVGKGKIIVGYHGALAQWIDYPLLRRIAEDERYFLLLIGHVHDENLQKSGLLKMDNVCFLGRRSYQELPEYTAFYDVAILPFVMNDITRSVSPVKIFEYMAAGKPVVSFGLPECKKYSSCLCADTQDEFMEQLENAVKLKNDKEYLKQLKLDAQSNTWTQITKQMMQVVFQAQRDEEVGKITLLNPDMSLNDKNKVLEQMLAQPRHRDEAYCTLTNEPYQRKSGDAKVIAYYLTQFHPDMHNELWWGKGTTEWNNVCRAVPQYAGHYQPRIPGELGYYDLRILDNMKRQIELARMYGIYGFSFYYYWFDGKRLLEKPLEAFLSAKELDFPFSICWANENWTRRYDGTNQDVLMEQPQNVESYMNVIHDMVRFLKDERYIQIDGKKMITVYRPALMPSHHKVLKYWRSICRKEGIGELYIIAVKGDAVDVNWLDQGFDAVSEFQPGTVFSQCEEITDRINFIRKDFGGQVFSYKDIVEKQRYFAYDYPKMYRAVMPMWDNTARRDNKGIIFDGSTPKLYKKWMTDVIQSGYRRTDLEENIVFINAWNEWGEGTYLEPDKRYGYAYLEATKEAVEETRKQ